MEELKATVTVRLLMREGETVEAAKERLYDLMYDGLCRTADHVCDFEIEETEEREAP